MLTPERGASPRPTTIEGTVVRIDEDEGLVPYTEGQREELPETTAIFQAWRQQAPIDPEAAFTRLLTLLGDRATLLKYNISLDLVEIGRMIAYGDQIGIHHGTIDPTTGEYVGRLKGGFNTGCNNMFEWLTREVRIPKALVRLAISAYQAAIRFEEFNVPLELLGSLSEGHIRRILSEDRDIERQVQALEAEKLKEMAHERGVKSLTKADLSQEEREAFEQEVGHDHTEQVRASILHIIEQDEADVVRGSLPKGTIEKPYLVLRGKYNPHTRQLVGPHGSWCLDLDEARLAGLEKNMLVLKFQIEGMHEPELQAGLAQYIRDTCPPEPDDDDDTLPY